MKKTFLKMYANVSVLVSVLVLETAEGLGLGLATSCLGLGLGLATSCLGLGLGLAGQGLGAWSCEIRS